MSKSIRTIANLITEDPDISADRNTTLLEWGLENGMEAQFQHPMEQRLAPLLDGAQIQQLSRMLPYEQAVRRAMDDLMMEFEAFQRHAKLKGPAAIEAFEYYKKNKRLPPHMARDSAELDQRGGRDFRPGV